MTQEIERDAAAYPGRLTGVSGAPERLWLRGVLPDGPSVAIVGARAASREALETARKLGRHLASRGVTVVSGGAIGVDKAAHEGALDGGGRTVVVLGTGIDVLYPAQHRALFERVVATGGALVSQFPRDAAVAAWRFPRRNHVIAALADRCVVIAAGATSGSIYTAHAAQRCGRELIALIGTPGCDRLVAEGARAARNIDDLCALVDGGQAAPAAPPSDPIAARLYAALDGSPRDLGELAARAGLDAGAALATAIDLELRGLALRGAGGRYTKVM